MRSVCVRPAGNNSSSCTSLTDSKTEGEDVSEGHDGSKRETSVADKSSYSIEKDLNGVQSTALRKHREKGSLDSGGKQARAKSSVHDWAESPANAAAPDAQSADAAGADSNTSNLITWSLPCRWLQPLVGVCGPPGSKHNRLSTQEGRVVCWVGEEIREKTRRKIQESSHRSCGADLDLLEPWPAQKLHHRFGVHTVSYFCIFSC